MVCIAYLCVASMQSSHTHAYVRANARHENNSILPNLLDNMAVFSMCAKNMGDETLHPVRLISIFWQTSLNSGPHAYVSDGLLLLSWPRKCEPRFFCFSANLCVVV